MPKVDFARVHRAFVGFIGSAFSLCLAIKLGAPFNKFTKFEGARSWQDVADALPAVGILAGLVGLGVWLFWPTRR